MPTTLDQLAERIAPTRADTNYFDPAPGQSVMSRYANSGRRLADSELAADASSRLLRSRADRLSMRQQEVKMDREEEKYGEYQDFKRQRNELLNTISAIDPEADDFESHLSEMMKTLPAEAMEDPVVSGILSAKQQRSQDILRQRQTDARDEAEFQRRLQIYNQRALADRRYDVLSPEERQSVMLPDGTFDQFAAASLAYEKSRQNKKDDQLEVAGTKRQWKIEDAKDSELDDSSRKLKTLAKEHTEGDSDAFPSQVQSIRARDKFKGKTGKALEDAIKKEPDYVAAKKYDSSRFVSELESARNMTEDAYVEAGGKDLDNTAKEKRRTVWKAARAGGAVPTPAASAPTPAAAPQGGGKPLDRETAAAIRAEAGGDKEKARQIARERGYSF